MTLVNVSKRSVTLFKLSLESESAFILPVRSKKSHYWQDTAKRPRRTSKSAAPMAVTLKVPVMHLFVTDARKKIYYY